MTEAEASPLFLDRSGPQPLSNSSTQPLGRNVAATGGPARQIASGQLLSAHAHPERGPSEASALRHSFLNLSAASRTRSWSASAGRRTTGSAPGRGQEAETMQGVQGYSDEWTDKAGRIRGLQHPGQVPGVQGRPRQRRRGRRRAGLLPLRSRRREERAGTPEDGSSAPSVSKSDAAGLVHRRLTAIGTPSLKRPRLRLGEAEAEHHRARRAAADLLGADEQGRGEAGAPQERRGERQHHGEEAPPPQEGLRRDHPVDIGLLPAPRVQVRRDSPHQPQGDREGVHGRGATGSAGRS